jgi:hypothetical protein
MWARHLKSSPVVALVLLLLPLLSWVSSTQAVTLTAGDHLGDGRTNDIVTSNFENANTYPVYITSIKAYSTYPSMSKYHEVWYRATPISTGQVVSTANGWVKVFSANVGVDSFKYGNMIIPGSGLLIPALTSYCVAVFCTDCKFITPNWAGPELITAEGVTLKIGKLN